MGLVQADPLAGTGVGAERQHPLRERVRLHPSVCPPPSSQHQHEQQKYLARKLQTVCSRFPQPSPHRPILQLGNSQMKVRGCWCVLPTHHPGSQPLIKTSALTSRFLCSEGLRAALPLAGGGQRVKLDVSPSPAVNAPTNTGAGLVASQGAMTEEGAKQRWRPEGEHGSGEMEAKTKEQGEVGKGGRGRSISLARHWLP